MSVELRVQYQVTPNQEHPCFKPYQYVHLALHYPHAKYILRSSFNIPVRGVSKRLLVVETFTLRRDLKALLGRV